MNVTIDMYATHVCNSSEGTKVSFMLREIIYGKSPINIQKSCMDRGRVTRRVP